MWTVISEMMLPLIRRTFSGVLTNILSINVADVLLTRVGLTTGNENFAETLRNPNYNSNFALSIGLC